MPQINAPSPLIQVLEQPQQQDVRAASTGRPHRPIEHLMVTGIVALVAAAHDAPRRRHGTLAWDQYRADQQDVGLYARSGS